MLCQLLISWVDIRLVTMRFTHGTFQVIRDDHFRYAAQELEGLYVCIQPVFLVLAPASTSKSVVGCAHHSDKYLGLFHFAGVRIHHLHRGAAIIDE